MRDIFGNEGDNIIKNGIVWFNMNKSICKEKVSRIPFSGLEIYYNCYKLKLINTKKGDRI